MLNKQVIKIVMDYCKTLDLTKDCSYLVEKLVGKFGGDKLCLKCKGSCFINLIRCPINGNVKHLSEPYTHHFVLVLQGNVYDVKHGVLGMCLENYIDLLNIVNKVGIRADSKMSTNMFGLGAEIHHVHQTKDGNFDLLIARYK